MQHFYGNAAVRSLADLPRWTISGQLGDDDSRRKAPVDIRELHANKRLRGAWSLDETCLMRLDELTEAFPNATNNAFYLRAQTDGLMVIDVEPGCPPEVATELVHLPEVLYSEVSMSGRGCHLLVPLPENFWSYPKATAKTVLREEHGWYELLLEHWVTFTRRPIEAMPERPSDPDIASTVDLYRWLAENARESIRGSVQVALDSPRLPYRRQILKRLTGVTLKEPGDFGDDMSRWEFSVLGTLYGHLQRCLPTSVAYSESDRAWLLYLAAVEVLPHRRKHDETRNGRPYLLDRAAALVASRVASEPA